MPDDDDAALDALVTRAVEWHVTGTTEDSDESYDQFLAATGEMCGFAMRAVAAGSALLTDADPLRRSAGADILCRLVLDTSREVHEASREAILRALQAEQVGSNDVDVIAAYATALGHLYDELTAPALIGLSAHEDDEVRLAVARALPSACDGEAPDDVTEVLVRLSADDNGDVRDWACFGLHLIRADGAAVRQAFVARLDDTNDEARHEALVGLAQLGDEIAVTQLLQRLANTTVWTLEVVAAGLCADPRLHPLLMDIRAWWDADDDDSDKLDFALRRCDPQAAALAESREVALVSRARSELEPRGLTVARSGKYPHTVVQALRNDSIITEHAVWDDQHPFSIDVELEADLVFAWACDADA